MCFSDLPRPGPTGAVSSRPPAHLAASAMANEDVAAALCESREICGGSAGGGVPVGANDAARGPPGVNGWPTARPSRWPLA